MGYGNGSVVARHMMKAMRNERRRYVETISIMSIAMASPLGDTNLAYPILNYSNHVNGQRFLSIATVDLDFLFAFDLPMHPF